MFGRFMVDSLDVSVIVDLVDAPFVESFLWISNLVDLFVDVNGTFVDFLDIVVNLVSISEGDIFPVLFSFIFHYFYAEITLSINPPHKPSVVSSLVNIQK